MSTKGTGTRFPASAAHRTISRRGRVQITAPAYRRSDGASTSRSRDPPKGAEDVEGRRTPPFRDPPKGAGAEDVEGRRTPPFRDPPTGAEDVEGRRTPPFRDPPKGAGAEDVEGKEAGWLGWRASGGGHGVRGTGRREADAVSRIVSRDRSPVPRAPYPVPFPAPPTPRVGGRSRGG
jgi:hypothetical protein